jgi:RNA-splicing ligase RtcB
MDKERLDDIVDELLTVLEEAKEHLGNAYEAMQTAARLCRKNRDMFGYNISGNMEAYVVNYIDGSPNSLVEKIEKYMEEVEEAKNLEIPEEDDE